MFLPGIGAPGEAGDLAKAMAEKARWVLFRFLDLLGKT